MEIKSLDITNIKGVKHLDFIPAKLNFITGPSGSGKSSVISAIRYAITGKTTEDFSRTDASGCNVLADFGRIGQVSRSIDAGKSKVKLNGKTTTAKSVAETMESECGVTMTAAGLATSSELLAHSLGKDLADYLLNSGFLKNDMTMKRLLALNPLDPDVAEELGKFLPPDPAIITLANIEEAYQHFRASRPSLKTMAAEEAAQGKYDGTEPTRTGVKANEDIIRLQTRIAAERKQAADYPNAKRTCEEMKKNIADVQARLKDYDGVTQVTARERKTADDNKLNATRLVDETRSAIRAAQQDADTMRRTLSALGTAVCPISKKLVCTTDKTGVRAELEEAIQMKLDSVEMLEKKLTDYEKSLADARAACDALVRQESDYRLRLSLTEQLERLQQVKVVIPDKPDPATLLRLENDLVALQAEMDDIRKYEEASKHLARANALSNTLRITEVLVKELAPSGGIRKQVLAHSIGPLEDWCNEQMKLALPKYNLRFDPDNSFAVMMEYTSGSAAGSRISYESLSNGEQLRVIFVIMAMLNELNGTGVFLLDNLNALDVNAFSEFLKLLESLEGSYDHIFISGIDHEGFTDIFNKTTVPHLCIDCGAI